MEINLGRHAVAEKRASGVTPWRSTRPSGTRAAT